MNIKLDFVLKHKKIHYLKQNQKMDQLMEMDRKLLQSFIGLIKLQSLGLKFRKV